MKNALKLYDQIHQFNFKNEKDFLKAHRILMKNLINKPGHYRHTNVGVLKGKKVAHMAPKYTFLPKLMGDLFSFQKNEKDFSLLILSCIVHYEIEFIHPFVDGNGRMGRFWQSLILIEYHPVFEYIPVESVIRERQEQYYKSLEVSDQAGQSEFFVAFILQAIHDSLILFIDDLKPEPQTSQSRLAFAKEKFVTNWFSRKDYQNVLKTISSATASRDLKKGGGQKILEKSGEKSQTRYRFKS